jgi:hypothetical protein
MGFISILFFFTVTWGFGYLITQIIKDINNFNFFERNIMRVGFGIAVFSFVILFLNLLKIPLNWWLIILLAIIFPIYDLLTKIKERNVKLVKIKLTKSNIYILIVFLFFLFTLSMYSKGAFSYHWFEDGDPWIHANGVKYIAVEKKLYEPKPHENILQYLDPYPPAYESILAMTYQVKNSDMIWTLKFFNNLLISLGIIFFYFFAKTITKKREKALFATFILTVIPSYMSHFIWAHSLIIMLIFPTLYAFELSRQNKNWRYIAGITYGAIIITQPTQAIKFSIILAMYIIIISIINKKIWLDGFLASIIGGILSLFWWIRPFVMKGMSISNKFSQTIEIGVKKWYEIKIPGSADRVYTFTDFFIAKGQNMINNPIGIGWVLVILLMITLILVIYNQFKLTLELKKYNKSISKILFLSEFLSIISLFLGFFSPLNIFLANPTNFYIQIILAIICFVLVAFNYIILASTNSENQSNIWISFTLLGLAFSFAGIHGATLPFQLFAFRFWMLFSIFLALLVSEGLWAIKSILIKQKTTFIFLMMIFIVGIIFTSALQKYEVNTAIWPTSGSIMQYGQLDSWKWFKENIPDDSKVYYACDNRFGDFAIISYDKFTCYWCKEERDSKKWILNQTSLEIHNWIKNKKYEYIIIDGNCIKTLGENKTNEKINEISQSRNFGIIHQGTGMVIFNVL